MFWGRMRLARHRALLGYGLTEPRLTIVPRKAAARVSAYAGNDPISQRLIVSASMEFSLLMTLVWMVR